MKINQTDYRTDLAELYDENDVEYCKSEIQDTEFDETELLDYLLDSNLFIDVILSNENIFKKFIEKYDAYQFIVKYYLLDIINLNLDYAVYLLLDKIRNNIRNNIAYEIKDDFYSSIINEAIKYKRFEIANYLIEFVSGLITGKKWEYEIVNKLNIVNIIKYTNRDNIPNLYRHIDIDNLFTHRLNNIDNGLITYISTLDGSKLDELNNLLDLYYRIDLNTSVSLICKAIMCDNQYLLDKLLYSKDVYIVNNIVKIFEETIYADIYVHCATCKNYSALKFLLNTLH